MHTMIRTHHDLVFFENPHPQASSTLSSSPEEATIQIDVTQTVAESVHLFIVNRLGISNANEKKKTIINNYVQNLKYQSQEENLAKKLCVEPQVQSRKGSLFIAAQITAAITEE